MYGHFHDNIMGCLATFPRHPTMNFSQSTLTPEDSISQSPFDLTDSNLDLANEDVLVLDPSSSSSLPGAPPPPPATCLRPLRLSFLQVKVGTTLDEAKTLVANVWNPIYEANAVVKIQHISF